jgi:hypothetical protein
MEKYATVLRCCHLALYFSYMTVMQNVPLAFGLVLVTNEPLDLGACGD